MTTLADNATPPPPAPRKRRRRWWWKVLLAIVVILLLLMLAAPALMSTGAGKNFLLREVNSRIAGTVTADTISLGWWSGASVRNLSVKDPQGQIILSVPSADTGLTLSNALSSSVRHLNIVVRAKNALLVTNADGTNNLSRAFAAKSPPHPQPAPKPSKPAPATAPAQSATVPNTMLPLIVATLDIQIQHITCESPNAPPLTIDNTAIKGRLDTVSGATQLTIAATAQSGNGKPAGLSLNLTGNFFTRGALKPLGEITGNGEAGVKSLDLAALTPLLAAAGANIQLTGTLDASAKLNQAAGKPSLDANITLAQLSAAGPMLEGDTFKRDQVALNLQATLAGATVDIQQFTLQTQDISANVNGSLQTGSAAGMTAPPPITIHSVLDVTNLKKQLPHLLGDIPDTTATIDFTGHADATTKTLTITRDSSIAEKNPQTGLGNTLRFNAGSVIAWGGRPNDMTVAITYDLSRAQQILAKDLPGGTTMQGARTMTLHITGALANAPGLAALQHISIDPATFGYDSITCKGFNLARADVGISMKNGVLTLAPSNLPANGGTIHLAGRVDCTQVPAAFILDKGTQGTQLVDNVSLNQEIAAGPLAFLPLAWGSDKSNPTLGQVTGKLNVNLGQTLIPLDSAAFKTTGITDGTISITNLTTDAPFFSQLFGALGSVLKVVQLNQGIQGAQISNGTFSLRAGKVTYQNLTLGAKQVNLTFSGAVGLDTSLAMNVDVTVAVLRIPIPVGIGGTTARPKLTISDRGLGKDIGKDVGNVIQNVVPGGLENLFKRKK